MIAVLNAKQDIDKDNFFNMVYNNEHGFGMLVRMKGKLKVIKELDEDPDPQKYYDLMVKYNKYKRYIHVRNNTAGDTSVDNLHPFKVYSDDKGKHTYFMHNGTLNSFKPEKDDTRSDSQIYCDQIVTPFLEMTNGNFTSDFAKKTLNEYWPGFGGRALIVSDKEDGVVLNSKDWETIKSKSGNIFVSNNTYFDKVTRGTEYNRRKKLEEQKRAKEGRSSGGNNVTQYGRNKITTIQDSRPNSSRSYLSDELIDLFSDWDAYEDNNCGYLGAVTLDEWENLVEKYPKDAAATLLWISSECARLVDEVEEAQVKHARATKKIAEFAQKEDEDGNV